jgi:hypothetical protein
MKNSNITKHDYSFDILDSLFMILPPHMHLIPGNNCIYFCGLTNISNALILHPNFYRSWSSQFHNFATVCKHKNYSPAFANSSFYMIKPTATTQTTTKKAEDKKSHKPPFLLNKTFCKDVDGEDDEYISAQDDRKRPAQTNQLTSHLKPLFKRLLKHLRTSMILFHQHLLPKIFYQNHNKKVYSTSNILKMLSLI